MSVGVNGQIKRSYSYKEEKLITTSSDNLKVIGISSIRYNMSLKNDKDLSIWK